MKQVYIVIVKTGMAPTIVYEKAFSTLMKAESYAMKLQKEVHPDKLPQYDSWGLCEGTEYSVVTMEVD